MICGYCVDDDHGYDSTGKNAEIFFVLLFDMMMNFTIANPSASCVNTCHSHAMYIMGSVGNVNDEKCGFCDQTTIPCYEWDF